MVGGTTPQPIDGPIVGSSHQPAALPVVLVHHGAPDWCRSSVASLLASEGVKAEITVVDNPVGTDGDDWLRLPPGVRLLRPDRNLGFAGGVNAGLAKWLADPDGGDLCLIGSHDLHVEPSTLATLLDVANRHREFGILGPRFTAHGGGGPRIDSAGNAGNADGSADDGEVEERVWVSGGAMLVRRVLFESVGLFDQRFGSYVEDVDLCLRARDVGWRVGVVPSAAAAGRGSASPDSRRLMYANQVLLRAKREGPWGATKGLVALPLLALRSAGRADWADQAERDRARARVAAVPLALVRLLRLLRPIGDRPSRPGAG